MPVADIFRGRRAKRLAFLTVAGLTLIFSRRAAARPSRLTPRPPMPTDVFDRAVVQAATNASDARLDRFYPILLERMTYFGVNTPERALAFLAQIGHESGGLKWVRELASGEAYEGREDLGNIYPGDGPRYKGRGLIQLTGRANYRRAGEQLGFPYEDNPEMVEEPWHAVEVALWYWRNGSARGDLNDFADQMNVGKPLDSHENLEAFEMITRGIQGAMGGWASRKKLWRAGRYAYLGSLAVA